jgi:hypothetical protein
MPPMRHDAADTTVDTPVTQRLPDAVRRFVSLRIDSVAELEGLLVVRSSPGQAWNAPELARRLYIREAEARSVLHALHREELLARRGDTFDYQPASDDLRRDVEALAAAYPRFLIPITRLIHAKRPPPSPEVA